MPILDRGWIDRAQAAGSCHYGERWLDLYASLIRKRALSRLLRGFSADGQMQTVLDLGCGDGRVAEWLTKKFGVTVDGVDLSRYPGVGDRVAEFYEADVESFRSPKQIRYDLALVIEVLTLVSSYRAVIATACKHSDRVLVIEKLQTPTPWWDWLVPYKVPLEMRDVVQTFRSQGFVPAKFRAMTCLDRRLFLWFPKFLAPLSFAVTLAVDWVLADWHVANPRFFAILFERRKA